MKGTHHTAHCICTCKHISCSTSHLGWTEDLDVIRDPPPMAIKHVNGGRRVLEGSQNSCILACHMLYSTLWHGGIFQSSVRPVQQLPILLRFLGIQQLAATYPIEHTATRAYVLPGHREL